MRRKKFVIIAAVLCLVAALATVVISRTLSPVHDSATTPETQEPSPTKTPTPEESTSEEPTPEATPSTLTIVAAGDVLLHMPVNESARTATGYDYTDLFSAVTPYISGADLAICGMETTLAPPGEPPSGYPMFGAPDEIIPSLKTSGWDGCSTANNHSADRGFAALSHNLDVFDENNLGHSGTARSEEEGNQTQFYTVSAGGRDVKIAHLSYTTVDNWIPGFPGKPWAWNVTTNERATHTVEEIVERSRQARDKGADLVVVSYHWGVEYETTPSDEERTVAQQLADSGEIDLVFGSHPHVAQPITKLEGGPDGQGMWIIYSMGNFISDYSGATFGINTLTGILATATIDVPASGAAHVSNLEWTAVTLDRPTHHLYLLADLESGRYTSTITAADLAQRRSAINGIMGTPERTVLPTQASELVSQERR
ncbi:MAG: CapA family protein [Actinomycetaceae bacterium]|nr:CapA family protein [Actinomycetaceae bacterium]